MPPTKIGAQSVMQQQPQQNRQKVSFGSLAMARVRVDNDGKLCNETDLCIASRS